MKTLCNEVGESVYLFPDFIPIRFDEDLGQWWIKDDMIPDIPHYYVLFEDVIEPKNWYKKKYSKPNIHGNYNGINLIGIDPLDFYEKYQEWEVDSFDTYIKALPTA